jgi:ABC-2 type transport system permease protein
MPPFVVIPTLLGVIGIMVLMCLFPTDKAYQVLSFMGLFFLAGMIMFFRFLSPEKFFDKKVSDEAIIAFVESLKMPEFGFHPSSWMTIGLSSWSEQHTGTALWQLLYLYVAAIVLGGVFWLVSRKIYFASWRSYQEVKCAPRDEFRKEGTQKPRWLSILPFSSMQKGLLHKDLIVFSRDPSYWSQLFILAALVVVYIFNIVNLPLENIVLKNVISVLNIGLIGFVLSALASRFVFSTTSLEGKKMWAVYTSPVKMESFLLGKFLMYFPPLLIIGEILVIVSNILLQVDAYVMQVSIIGVVFITIGVVGMAVGMGAMYPKFEYENVSEISSGTGGILFIISSLIYVGLVIILGARPMYVHFKQIFAFGGAADLEVMGFYFLIIVLSFYVAIEPMRRGIHALKTRDF